MYLTAGELSDMLGISKQTVLYYDRIGLFSPAGRDEKGYRYYTCLLYTSIIEKWAEI